jgi:hypothetical protein
VVSNFWKITHVLWVVQVWVKNENFLIYLM